MSIAAFRNKLSLLAQYLDDPEVTEIAVNRPGELWLGRQGHRYMTGVVLPGLNYGLLESLADVTAHYTSQKSDKALPLLSATIPINLNEGVPDSERGGYRVQVVRAPATEEGSIALCVRKPTLLDLTLSDYTKAGAFDKVNKVLPRAEYSDDHLRELYKRGAWEEFLRGAVLAHKNIVISAGTNAGKTTNLNALIKEIPKYERIVTIEDSQEVRPIQPNRLHLLYSRGDQGISDVTAVDLMEASLRLTPDRLIMGELRGSEAYIYLEVLNSGHTGSITTIHADNTRMMFDRLAQMIMRFGSSMSRDQIIEYSRSLIQVVVQFQRGDDGSRYVSEILYDAS